MSLTTPYREQFLEADGITITFPFDDHGDGFDAISKNYVKCEVYNADGSVIVPGFTVDLSAKTITITSLTTPDGQVLNAPQNGAIVRIYRDVPEAQNTTAQALQASTAQQIVQNFDNIVAMIQELQYANEHFTLRSTLPQRDLKIDLLRDIDDQKLVYWDNEKRKLVVTNYRQDELLLPADKEDILAQANAYSDAKNDSLEEKINGKLSAVDMQIDANADAILKTREDFASADQAIRDDMNAEDSRLQTQITAQATAITTNKNDIDELGDDVAEIQAKIPESASGSNPLITKQQLLDEEMDIRKDLNGGLSELQTQITAQAAKIETKQDKLTAGDNIIISNNVISATGAGGGAGFDIIVVQELPAEGQKGIIYLLAKDGEAPDVYDEYVWITATQTFELIGSTKVDLSNYLPLSGGTLTGSLSFKGGSREYEIRPTAYGNLEFFIDGTKTIDLEANVGLLPNGKGVYSLGRVGRTWKNVYTAKLNNGADLAIPTEGGTLARLEDLEGLGGLPDQTDNAGKFLTTDGTTASWGNALVNLASVAGGIAIGLNSSADQATSVSIGNGAGKNYGSNIYSVAVGANTQTSSLYSTAIGGDAKVTNSYAVQIGKGTNTEHGTVCFGNKNGNFKIMSADGTIPADRIGNLDFGTMD